MTADKHDPTQHTPAEKEWARKWMQQRADDNSEVRDKVDQIFHDRRNSDSE